MGKDKFKIQSCVERKLFLMKIDNHPWEKKTSDLRGTRKEKTEER
jgi:hypothetical protein